MFSSCAGRSLLRQDKISDAVAEGDFLTAISLIRENDNLYGRNNEFLYNMDIGVLFHYAGKFDSSNTYLMRAADVYDELFARSVTNEAAAILVNDNIRPYRSKPYEIVHLHMFAALNFMAMGRVDDALVETRRMQLHFNEWERRDRSGNRYTNDGMFHLISSIIYEQAGEIDNSLISLFKSVQAYQNGPVPLPSVVRDYAYTKLVTYDRAADTARLNITAPEGNSVWELNPRGSEIVVVSYAGRGPVLRETVWAGTYVKDGLLVLRYTDPNGNTEVITTHAPALPQSEYEKANQGQPTRSGTTFRIKVALPMVSTSTSRVAHFTADPGTGNAKRSVVVSDIDLLARDYHQDNWNATLSRTVVRVILRTIAAERTKAQMRTDNPVLNLLLNLGTDVVTDQMERADVRNCFLLPQTIHLTRIPVDTGTHSVTVKAYDRNGNVIRSKNIDDITVRRGERRFVFNHSFY
ncbi:putative lipoprotein [Chitinispirillum alkaliphilum]|nr:putative lipoprotein [Chitinispirillum alkaliphilum]